MREPPATGVGARRQGTSTARRRARNSWRRRVRRARRLVATILAQLRTKDPYLNSEVAFLRALGSKERDPQLRGADTLAEHFLTSRYRLALRADRAARWLIELSLPGAYGYIQARTKYIDHVLLEAARSGIGQLVILGAGNDSRAYRLQSELSGVRTFEVDLAEAQQHKRRVIGALYGEPSPSVRYVPFDFEQAELDRSLLQAGFDVAQRTFFLWEGVCMFLSAEGVDNVVRALRRLAAPGSTLVFDYCLRRFTQGQHGGFGGLGLATLLERRGEQYRFGFDAGEAAQFLAQRGFEVTSDLGPEELERRYLVDSAGRLRARVFRNFRLLSAKAQPGACT